MAAAAEAAVWLPDQPAWDCPLCPRLVAYRISNRAAFPQWHNAPVPSFGPLDGRLLIVGLAPGLRGANRTGRPFTGDYAGVLLYETLLKHRFAHGHYGAEADDGLELTGCRISNAVRCAPPGNLPEPTEIRACNMFLKSEVAAMPDLRAILALGVVAHQAVLRALGQKLSKFGFAHGAEHKLDGRILYDSYHVSRYNTNTGKLTAEMFDQVIAMIRVSI